MTLDEELIAALERNEIALRELTTTAERLDRVLRVVLARLEHTVAAGWVAPNPDANQRSGDAQYRGTLSEFLLTALRGPGS